jgi:hypothetical protein
MNQRWCQKFLLTTAVGVLACGVASADYISGFEPPTYSGSPGGTDLNGQDGFYNPLPDQSISCQVYTYAGNVLGIPPHPINGGEQFVAGTGPGDGVYYARSQRDIPHGATGLWTASVDIAATFVGQLPTADNIGSLSTTEFDLSNPPNATFISLARWTDPATGDLWNADYVVFDAAGNYVYPAVVPDPAFHDLPINHWYRWSNTYDLDTNMIVEVALTDLTTGQTATWNPPDWYLGGGAAGGLPPPSGFRFFAGCSTVYGNTLAFDNLSIVPEPATLSLLGLGGLIALRRRR